MVFELEQFISAFEADPSFVQIDQLKKVELLEVAAHYKADVKSTMRKDDIKLTLVKILVENKLLPEDLLPKAQQSDTKYELELHRLKFEHDIRVKELEVRMKELDIQAQTKSTNLNSQTFDVSKHIRLVPPFQEKDVDKYFTHFEKVAISLNWPKKVWTPLLQSVILGKAQEVYSALSIEHSNDYELVKETILKSYELVPEAYRQKFHGYQKADDETYVEFARQKEVLFDRWCASKQVHENFNNLRQLMLIEELKACVPNELKMYLDDQKVTNLQQAASLADDYTLTHKTISKLSSNMNNKHKYEHKHQTADIPAQSVSNVKSSIPDHRKSNVHSIPVCAYCKRKGHLISDCWLLEKKKAKPSAFITKTQMPCSNSDFSISKNLKCPEVELEFKPFVTEGFISVAGSNYPPTPIKILRDTGASQSLLLDGVLPLSEQTATDQSVLLQGIGGYVINVPLHKVELKSDLVSGLVVVGVRPTLPIEGISLLLGNDLAGEKIIVNPHMIKKPCSQNDESNIENGCSFTYPSCAVTRAMSKKMSKQTSDNATSSSMLDLSQTFMANSELDKQNISGLECQFMPEPTGSIDMSVFTRDKLIGEQESDPELSMLRSKALSFEEIDEVPSCYYLKSGILMRKWRPPDAKVDEEWRVVHQVVVPPCYRSDIVSLAHDSPMAGHLGVNKTFDRIQRHFYWPGIRRCISHYCRTCHTCQKVGKPNQKIPVAPLKPIPSFDQPFSHILIDCVGPLPKTKSGNEYILSIMCTATRFPEAIPLRKISAPNIVKALIKFFTLFGLPKYIQSDQGTNFMSKIFQQVTYQLGIKQLKSTAYHPQSQGALERFHQTMKKMMKTFCFEQNKDWDESIPLLLFAIREVVQESLGFSPFELVFGHTVRGPLKLVKEAWLDDDQDLGLLSYISIFKDRLFQACEAAKTNLQNSQHAMKTWYDKHARKRTFKTGDKVLVLLPEHKKPLQARYYGPCTVEQKVNELNYVVATPGRKTKQLCHI